MRISNRLQPWRTAAELFVALGALALLMATVGVYSVVSVLAAERRGEFGLRLALGARGSQIAHLVLRDGIIIVAAGIVLGGVAALAASHLVQALLFEASPYHSATYSGALMTMSLSVLVAMWRPASRAAAADPLSSLRGR